MGKAPGIDLLARKLSQIQDRIAELERISEVIRSALDCGCRSLESCQKVAQLASLGRLG
jgi:hypothetical protein